MDEDISLLRCSRCKEYKPEDEFASDKHAVSRNCKAYRCKECNYEWDPEAYRESHLEELKEIFQSMGYDVSMMHEDKESIHRQFMERNQEFMNRPYIPQKKTRIRKKDDPNYRPMKDWTPEERRAYYRKYNDKRRR